MIEHNTCCIISIYTETMSIDGYTDGVTSPLECGNCDVGLATGSEL